MKRFLSLIALVLCVSILASPPTAAASPAFTDISGHWAESTIERFADAGIISGFPDGSFRPDQDVTRAELAVMLTRAFDLSEGVSFGFPDVHPGAWYYEYMRSAARFIPHHQFGGSFAGTHAAHRIDVATAFVSIKQCMTNIAIDMPPHEDMVQQVRDTFRDSDYRVGAIGSPIFRSTWLAHHLGIMEGFPDGYFRPAWGVTRADVLTMIDRMLSVDAVREGAC